MKDWLAFYILLCFFIAFVSFLIGTMFTLKVLPPPHISIGRKNITNQPQSKNSEVPPFVLLEVTATAYSPSPDQTRGHPRQMASGKYATKRTLGELRYLAVSRDLKNEFGLDWGDEVFLSFRVEDLMAERKEKQVDLFMKDEGRARDFGRQKRKVIILKGDKLWNSGRALSAGS